MQQSIQVSPIRQKIRNEVLIPEVFPKQIKHNRAECYYGNSVGSAPSFEYFPHDKSWCCYKCGTGGDVVNLYQHIYNLDRNSAIKTIIEDFKIETDDKDFQAELDLIEAIEYIFTDFMQKCHENLQDSSLYKKIMEKRGFTKETMEMFHIGLFDDKIRTYMERNYDSSTLTEFGFTNTSENWSIGKRIVYPYLDIHNKPMYFTYRLIDDAPDFNHAKYIAHYKTKLINKRLFGINSSYMFRGKPLIITEGITDVISVVQNGFPCLC